MIPTSLRYWMSLFGVLMVVSPALAQNSWVGEMAVPGRRAKEIRISDRVNGAEVSYAYNGNYPLKVRDDRDGRVRIHDGEHEGWVAKTDFVLAREAERVFNDRVKANPQDAWALF